jgi:putative Holliday junction resolvase
MQIQTFLGFDVGTKRTGVAIANSLIGVARGIGVVNHYKNGATNWEAIDQLVSIHQPNQLIVGLALTEAKAEQEISLIARSFARKLGKRYDVDVVLVDEYLSSFEAKKNLKYNHCHPRAKRAEVDKESAQLILQTWLNE